MENKEIPSLKSVDDIDAVFFLGDTVAVLKYIPEKRKMVSFARPIERYTNIEFILNFIKLNDVIGFKKISQAEDTLEKFQERCRIEEKEPNIFIRKSLLEDDGAICFARPPANSALLRVFIPYERSNRIEMANAGYPLDDQRYILARVSAPEVFYGTVLNLKLEDNPIITSILLRLEITQDFR